MRSLSCLSILVTAISFVSCVSATKVNQCPNDKFSDLEKHVIVGDCVDPPCVFKKNTRLAIKMKFKAESDLKELTRYSHINLSGIKLPFIGVDSTSACEYIYEADEKTPSYCNIVKGKSYVYIDGVDILPMFPKIKGLAHWSLTDPSTGKDIICVELLVHIVG